MFGSAKPTPEQISHAAEQLRQQAVTPLLKATFCRRILEIRAQNEQTTARVCHRGGSQGRGRRAWRNVSPQTADRPRFPCPPCHRARGTAGTLRRGGSFAVRRIEDV